MTTASWPRTASTSTTCALKRRRTVVSAAGLPGGNGFIGKISLSFNARKVIFDFRENPNAGFRIWEVNVDGTGLRQVSFAPAR